jgi:MSHA biogenesis protein MshJ
MKMNKPLSAIGEKISQLTLRERVLVILTISVLLIFLWWSLSGAPLRAENLQIRQQNQNLQIEIATLNTSTRDLRQRLAQGMHEKERQKLQQLKQELEQVKQRVRQKTHALIEPDEMFELMQQMLFAESRLKLTMIKRKAVLPLFAAEQGERSEQPEIYRHVMKIGFDGHYRDVVNYIKKLEGLKWKLTWDHIELRTIEYPKIHVDIEISTLSDNLSWVGL